MMATTTKSVATLQSDLRWQAVLQRDAAADGRFVYAVRTTGIYCRVTCASRRPRQENVEFFSTTEAARRAGYRACERCRPDAPAADAEVVARACRLLHEDAECSAADVAKQVGISQARLTRAFKNVLGVSVKQYAMAQRLQRFRGGLQTSKSKITDAMYAAGFSSSSRLYESAPSKLGMTPTKYKRGGVGELIRYTTADSSLGRMLVAATTKGICAIAFGDSEGAMVRDLQQRFAKAEIARDESSLEEAVRVVTEKLREPARAFALPLDLRATAFQQRVWNALKKIPVGETRSYAAVAKSLGRPTAARAVARACAGNPVAVVVPCHRVVAGDGSMAGYRWGVARKKKLLAQEADASCRIAK